MSALAHILLERKMQVGGSDTGSSSILEELKAKGAQIAGEHHQDNISPDDIVVFSSAVTKQNPEYRAAVEQGCHMLHRSELLAELMKEFTTVGIAGTHGKTTASSLLAAIFVEAKLDPTYAIGGLLEGVNGRKGEGKHFLFEADESDGSFLNYFPDYALVTNLEEEHMDHYRTYKELEESYATFLSQVGKHVVFCADDANLSKIAKGTSYGFSERAQYRLTNFRQEGWHLFFDLKEYGTIEAALVGRHNALNVAGAFLLAKMLQVPEKSIREALKKFAGVRRRCEKKGEEHGVLRIDDYAHHPSEIAVTLRAIKEAVQERRLIALFQPHRYCRTQDHLEDFGRAFEWADHVIVTDIYQAREEAIENLSAHSVIEKINKYSTVPCEYVSRKECVDHLAATLRPHDVLVTLGAGDITSVHRPFKPKKWKVGVVSGGRSNEHEISVRSGKFVKGALNPEFYDVIPFHIHQSGEWSTDEITAPLHKLMDKIEECEIFMPILHGLHGEDGTLQGFFETLQKVYVGSDHLSASLSMNKVLAKQLAEKNGVPTPSYAHFHHRQWLRDREKCLHHNLSYPVFVKPVHLGSSIGITQVKRPDQLEEAIEKAFRFDTHVMIEEGKMGCRELEFACVGNAEGFDICVPHPGEKIAYGEFVDYEKKYGEGAVSTSVDPTLSKETLAKGREYAKKAYLAMQCGGLTRVDFLLDSKEQWWFFELNAIPGMQPLSLFPKIWKRDGVDASALMDRLIVLAIARQTMQNRHR